MNHPKKIVTAFLKPHVETVLPTGELRSRKQRKNAVPFHKQPVPHAPAPNPATKAVVVVHDTLGGLGCV